MNRPRADAPERLLGAADATDFERRLLGAAAQSGPSPAASARMARALGLTATVTVTAVGSTAVAAQVAASKAVAAGASAVWPWVSAGVIGLAVAGAVVGTRVRHAPPPEARVATRAVIRPSPPAEPPPSAPQQSGAVAVEAPRSAPAPGRRTHAAPAPGALADQIAFIDGARQALADGAHRPALDLLRRYQERYPAGSFRPEATALKVEALVKLGRQAEARALAERFVAEHRGSLLAARVAELSGVAP
jgi:hypothetical protein